MLGLCGSSSVYRYAPDTCRWMAHTRAARAATSRVQWTKKGQKFAKNLPAFLFLFWLLINFMFCFLSQRTWLDLIQFGHGTRFYYSCTNRLSYFILNTFVAFRCWVFDNPTPSYLCVSPQKDCESRTRTYRSYAIYNCNTTCGTSSVSQIVNLSQISLRYFAFHFLWYMYDCRFSRASHLKEIGRFEDYILYIIL